jgi:HEAT repeat protein
VLADVVASTPEGREQWRRALAGLVALGDDKAKAALTAELSQPDPQRAVAAAAILAAHDDAHARAYLERVMADHEFARRGDAANALAMLGDAAALDWVAEGLHSADAGERKLAVSACAHLAHAGADRFKADVVAIATTDKDRSVQLTADAALLAL